MDNKQIKELMAAMERLRIKKLSIKEKGGFELSLEREDAMGQPHSAHHVPSGFHPHPYHPHPEFHPRFASHHHEHQTLAPETKPSVEAVQGTFIKAPMVGTFYSSPSPEDPAFIKVGDKVEADTVVCIIEAMKVMNEVKAQVSGTVAEILLDNGQPVEFGTHMIRII